MEMNYRKMVEHAKRAGVTNEHTMWQSIDSFSELLEELEESHPVLYWAFMRKQQGLMYGGHYNEEFAKLDVSDIKYTNRAGEEKEGAHWSVEEVETATKGMVFPEGTTKWDKWVAGAVMYSDLCKKLDEPQILESMYLFFFDDEDWRGSDPKLWAYMNCKSCKK